MSKIIDRIKQEIKDRKIAKVFPEFKDEEIDKILDEAVESKMYEYKPISKRAQLAFLLTGANGIFTFIQSKTDNKEYIYEDIKTMKETYAFPNNGVFSFIRTPTTNYFIGSELALHEIEDLPKNFITLYNNTLIPLVDFNYIHFNSDYEMLSEPQLPDEYKDENGNPIEVEDTGDISFIQPFVSKSILKVVNKKIDKAFIDDRENNKDIKYDENGQKYRKFPKRTAILKYSFTDVWYPVAADDPLKFTLITLFGGWFGLHKFLSGEKLQGLLYLMTCGGFGVFYLIDLTLLIFGHYSIKRIDYTRECNEIDVHTGFKSVTAHGNKIKKCKTIFYIDTLPEFKQSLIIFLIGIVISFVSVKCIYNPIQNYISQKTFSSVTDTTSNIEENIDTNISDSVEQTIQNVSTSTDNTMSSIEIIEKLEN